MTLAATTAYDAAVVDIMLPKLDGLSLVKAVVEAHRGQVYVTSKVGEGSEFTVTLSATAVAG